ncbi:MAG: hypothetical protein QHH15_00400 [Candidatus Thermoplasmatota archaeon]|nr:hypothetical protein [Candidatus Thermoplasmatota archaeon]MDH7506234.1 hypothetical protein [Candidatus Thermoplasmatota archaeon]
MSIITKEKTIAENIKPVSTTGKIEYFCNKCDKKSELTSSEIANTFMDYTIIDLSCGHCIIQKL